MPEDEILEKRVDHINKLIEATEKNFEKIKSTLDQILREQDKDKYRDKEGVEGVFDGVNLVGEDGKRYEVQPNYAAKSRLVYGDRLKMIAEGGKEIFKQIEKVPRKKINGIISKKEGKWYILADSGSYLLSDIAAEYQNVELNDEAIAYIPEDNLRAPYAALDKVKKSGEEINQKNNKQKKDSEKVDKAAGETQETNDSNKGKTKPSVEKPKKKPQRKKSANTPVEKKSNGVKSAGGLDSGKQKPPSQMEEKTIDISDKKDNTTSIILEEDDLR